MSRMIDKRETYVVTYIFFLDDCLIVGKAIIKDMECIKVIVDMYCSLSVQAINLSKS